MVCPRCGNEWDVRRSPCSRCGLLVPLSRPSATTGALPIFPAQPSTTTSSFPALRPKRLITIPLTSEELFTTGSHPKLSSRRYTPLPLPSTPTGSHPLLPGIMLRNARYHLQRSLGSHQWLHGATETLWLARDTQHSGALVTISEMTILKHDAVDVDVRSILRTATIALASVSRHPRTAALWDAFSEKGRHFFVFEPVDGEPLSWYLSSAGRFSELDAIECCLQMTEILEQMSAQSPPLVHGLIHPDHIMVNRKQTHYTLTNFSLIMAGGAFPFVAGIERSRLSDYTAPEFSRQVSNTQHDLYSLLATAYYMVTGHAPLANEQGHTLLRARQFNAALSPEFDAIIAKGLHMQADHRYLRPAALSRELLALRTAHVTNAALPAMKPPLDLEVSLLVPMASASLAAPDPYKLQMDQKRKEDQPQEFSSQTIVSNTMHFVFLWALGIGLSIVILLLFTFMLR